MTHMTALHSQVLCPAPPIESVVWKDGVAMLAYILMTRTNGPVFDHGLFNWLAMDKDGAWWLFWDKPIHGAGSVTSGSWACGPNTQTGAQFVAIMRGAPMYWEEAIFYVKKPT